MKELKVALVVPNHRWTGGDAGTFWHFVPYNLCLLAAMVRDICSVEIIDCNFYDLSYDDFQARLRQGKFDVVGLTVLMDQFAVTGHKAAALTREALPEATVLLGGVYCTTNPERAIADKNIDYGFIGEGEFTFRQFIEHLLGRAELPSKGIIYRDGDKVVNTGRADFIQDMDSIPLPAYDLIDFPKYSRTAERKSVDAPSTMPYAWVISSRGCPIGCAFCQVKAIQGLKFRPRSAENVLQEIRWLKKEYGIKSIIFMDDNLYTDRERLKAILNAMKEEGLTMPWTSPSTAVFFLTEEILDLMRETGCEFICIAIESGTQRVLKEIIHKPIEFTHVRKMIRYAQSLGIYVAANFIIGFPTETWSEIRQTIHVAEDLGLDYAKIFHAIPLPKTRLWDLCVEHKAFKGDFDMENLRWSDGQIETDQFTPNDLTVLRAYEWDRINFSSEKKLARTAERMQISVEELNEIRKQTRLNAHKNIHQYFLKHG